MKTRELSGLVIGLSTYEDKRLGKDQMIRRYLDANYGGSASQIDATNEEHAALIKKSIIFDHPEWKDDQFELIDCRGLKDPFRSSHLRKHLGFHPEILDSVSNDIHLWRVFHGIRMGSIDLQTG